MEFFAFDQAYYQRLRERDPQTENHFVAYFRDLLQIKLRSRLNSRQAIDDVEQETFLRVLAVIRSEGGIRQPERLGAFVNSVCNNVLLETYRAAARNPQEHEQRPELADTSVDLDGYLMSEQASAQVSQVLDQLSEKDQRVLRAVFLEDKGKDAVCREFGVERDYLRVLLHRAKQNFRAIYEQKAAASKTTERPVGSSG